MVIKKGDFEVLLQLIEQIRTKPYSNKNDKYMDYLRIYHEIVNIDNENIT